MNVILYMATTINGLIADENDKADWISNDEWDSYSRMVRAAGCMIIGHRTYDIITKQPEFSEFKDVRIIVVSNTGFELLSDKHSISHSPHEALEVLKDYNSVIVAGRGILNSSFLTANLVDEIYVDIEPIAIGHGIPLFKPDDFSIQLKLLEFTKLSDNEIQLHYKVTR